MNIDSHQHFWRYNAAEFDWISDAMQTLRRDFLPPDLQKELCENRFDGSVAVQARQSLEETRWLLELADVHPAIKGVVGWVDLCSPEVAGQLARFTTNRKFVGVRHIVQDEPDEKFLLKPEFVRGVRQVQECGLTYDILVYPWQLPAAVQFVNKFQGGRFVLDHIAKPLIRRGALSPWKEHMKELAGCPNLFCKVSGMVTEADWKNWTPADFKPYLDTVFEYFGPRRVMIGSDWPVCLVAGCYRKVVSIVLEYIALMSEEDKGAVLGGNAVRAYKLNVA